MQPEAFEAMARWLIFDLGADYTVQEVMQMSFQDLIQMFHDYWGDAKPVERQGKVYYEITNEG
ncbi:MAG: hypothetical protein EBR88_07505, partial [Betaproteobacteria bacterium]|nr:hypothetical protein [Betaproteobacteria bacterium]